MIFSVTDTFIFIETLHTVFFQIILLSAHLFHMNSSFIFNFQGSKDHSILIHDINTLSQVGVLIDNSSPLSSVGVFYAHTDWVTHMRVTG